MTKGPYQNIVCSFRSVYLEESNGGCREIILNDFLEGDEVREKQLLGVDLSIFLSKTEKYLIFYHQP